MTSPRHDPIPDILQRSLGSQYEVLGVLGRGGMGVVYRARETFLERDAAIKVLPSEMASDPGRERFLREARTAARLSHPNIVPLYTFGEAGELLYYVMGFVDGESLESRLRRERRLELDEALRITAELADALDYAHRAGVVHRDVKPDNVLLDRHSGRAILTDFGIAKQNAGLDTLTQTGVIVGTPHYMSPEQGAGERDIDGRSDLYSLAVIAYRMITGRLPFDGSGLRDVLAQHATRVPVLPTQVVPSLPPSVDTVIMRGLAKVPAERWPTARAMRDALGTDNDESLPESLRSITGMGPRLAVTMLGFTNLAFLGHRFGWWDGETALWTTAAAVLIPLLVLIGTIQPLRRFGLKVTAHHFLRQPGWWSSWWPRFARRPGDVWHRLPRDVRMIRAVSGWGVLINLVLMNVMLYGITESVRTGRGTLISLFPWVVFGLIGLFAAMVAPRAWRFTRLARSHGLSRPEAHRVMGASTWGTFWDRPHIAALLGASGVQRTVKAADPGDLLRDIERLARDEAASPHATLYREAAAAAAQMCGAIKAIERELAQLARDRDPGEQERIAASLAALGSRVQDDSTVKAQMRDLLDRQLSLFADLAMRQDQVAARRDLLLEQLRTLALQLALLRSAPSPDTVSDITGRIRSVCREIEYRVEGERAVRV